MALNDKVTTMQVQTQALEGKLASKRQEMAKLRKSTDRPPRTTVKYMHEKGSQTPLSLLARDKDRQYLEEKQCQIERESQERLSAMAQLHSDVD